MKQLTIAFILVFAAISLYAQNISLLSENKDFTKVDSIADFEFINPDFNFSKAINVAEYEVKINRVGDYSFMPLFQKLKRSANRIGANAFSITQAKLQDGVYTAKVTVYYLDSKKMAENFEDYNRNAITIFGKLNTLNDNHLSECRINGGGKTYIKAFDYARYQNNPRGNTTIKVGGLLGGLSASVNGEEDKLGVFYSLDSEQYNPMSNIESATNLDMNASIDRPTIVPIDQNLGYFISVILDLSKK